MQPAAAEMELRHIGVVDTGGTACAESTCGIVRLSDVPIRLGRKIRVEFCTDYVREE